MSQWHHQCVTNPCAISVHTLSSQGGKTARVTDTGENVPVTWPYPENKMRILFKRLVFPHHLAVLAVNKLKKKTHLKLLCSIFHSHGVQPAGDEGAAALVRGSARRQDLLLLDVHKTSAPMLILLHSSVV